MKYIHLYSLFLMLIFHSSCGQNQTKDKVTSPGSNEKYPTKYEYTDPTGKSLFIQNSVRKGGPYTDPKGISYGKVIFWTRLINETDNPLELKIDFPVDSFEVPGLTGKYYKLLVPPDTMTIDKEPLYDYGLTGLSSFLDNNSHKQSTLKRTINPKESSGFYVVILFEHWMKAPFGAELSIKGQNLVYRISRYESKPAGPIVYEKEINCGSINLKNLKLKPKTIK